MSIHQTRIEEFMKKAGQDLPDKVTVPDEATRLLRAKLILEEAFETVHALGFIVRCDSGDCQHDLGISNDDLELSTTIMERTGPGLHDFEEVKVAPNLIEIADGCADISVVAIGTLSACGIKDDPLLAEVDESNLRKFGEGSYRREDGKWMKPPDWRAPNIEQAIGHYVTPIPMHKRRDTYGTSSPDYCGCGVNEFGMCEDEPNMFYCTGCGAKYPGVVE